MSSVDQVWSLRPMAWMKEEGVRMPVSRCKITVRGNARP